MPRPISLEISIPAMRHNLDVVRRRVGSSKIWAVAKANAYGQGIELATSGFDQADGLAVLDLQEAVRARQAGWKKPILLMEGAFSAGDLREMAALELTTVITCKEQAQEFLECDKVPTRVWFKLNTGMNRLGFAEFGNDQELADTIEKISKKINGSCGVMTHFANADHEGGCDESHAEFMKRVDRLKARIGDRLGPVSMANSAASFCAKETHADWVRPGIVLYGATPFTHDAHDHNAQALGLLPVQRLSAQVIALQTLKPGQAVGYGGRFVAQRESRIAVIACGYADGYPRVAPDGTPVWIEGMTLPLAGRVSMDMITVDVTDHPAVQRGSVAELWGTHVAIDDVANRAATVGYELMTKVTARVPRVVVHG